MLLPGDPAVLECPPPGAAETPSTCLRDWLAISPLRHLLTFQSLNPILGLGQLTQHEQEEKPGAQAGHCLSAPP